VNTGFWVGLAVAIPLSIVANLATPAVQNWLADRNKRLDDKRQKQQEEMGELIKLLRSNVMAYANFLSNSFMRLLLVVVLIFIVLNIPFYAQTLLKLIVCYQFCYPLEYAIPVAVVSTIVLLTGLLVYFMNTIRKTRLVMRAIVLSAPLNKS
jgi:hypothetical protein